MAGGSTTDAISVHEHRKRVDVDVHINVIPHSHSETSITVDDDCTCPLFDLERGRTGKKAIDRSDLLDIKKCRYHGK